MRGSVCIYGWLVHKYNDHSVVFETLKLLILLLLLHYYQFMRGTQHTAVGVGGGWARRSKKEGHAHHKDQHCRHQEVVKGFLLAAVLVGEWDYSEVGLDAVIAEQLPYDRVGFVHDLRDGESLVDGGEGRGRTELD